MCEIPRESFFPGKPKTNPGAFIYENTLQLLPEKVFTNHLGKTKVYPERLPLGQTPDSITGE